MKTLTKEEALRVLDVADKATAAAKRSLAIAKEESVKRAEAVKLVRSSTDFSKKVLDEASALSKDYSKRHKALLDVLNGDNRLMVEAEKILKGVKTPEALRWIGKANKWQKKTFQVMRKVGFKNSAK